MQKLNNKKLLFVPQFLIQKAGQQKLMESRQK